MKTITYLRYQNKSDLHNNNENCIYCPLKLGHQNTPLHPKVLQTPFFYRHILTSWLMPILILIHMELVFKTGFRDFVAFSTQLPLSNVRNTCRSNAKGSVFTTFPQALV